MADLMDRRSVLQAGLGLASLPVIGGLAGCAQTPGVQAAAGEAVAAQLNVGTRQLTDRVTVITGAPGNLVAVAAGDGLVLVDSGATGAFRAVQQSLGGQRVHTLFNTHYHADQTGGNASFAKQGATIHAHTITKQWLAADYYVPSADRWVKAPPKEAVPTVTFRGRGEMKAGNESIEFGYLLEAHTRGDAYVFFRDSNVLVAGDVVSPLRDPVLDWYAGGWLGGMVDALDDLLEVANEQTLVVPAYGPVLSRAELQAERDMIDKLYELLSSNYHKGRSAQDMLKDGLLGQVQRKFDDPARFLYDVVKGLQAHYTNFGGNVV